MTGYSFAAQMPGDAGRLTHQIAAVREAWPARPVSRLMAARHADDRLPMTEPLDALQLAPSITDSVI